MRSHRHRHLKPHKSSDTHSVNTNSITPPASSYLLLKETTSSLYRSHGLLMFILRLHFRYKFLIHILRVIDIGDILRNPQTEVYENERQQYSWFKGSYLSAAATNGTAEGQLCFVNTICGLEWRSLFWNSFKMRLVWYWVTVLRSLRPLQIIGFHDLCSLLRIILPAYIYTFLTSVFYTNL